MSDVLRKLIGRLVISVSVSLDANELKFITDMGDVGIHTDGGCCSETWFSDLIGLTALLGGRVTAVESLELPDYNCKDGRSRQQEDVAYGHRITTEVGFADLIYRNSSNGFYGGWLSAGDAKEAIIPITCDDWSA